MALPTPESDELSELPISYQARAFYRVLYEHRDTPLTAAEMREHLGVELSDQEQIQRRRRELNRYFVIERGRRGRDTTYRLIDRKPRLAGADAGISERDRAAVLRHGRCAMCGRTPLEDRVRLEVDHRIPKEWGGTDDLENLQPLCEECNRGKKNLFASLNEYADKIRGVLAYTSVHQRIGEFLKAVHPEEVRSDVLEMVASPPGDYQEDWQKRTRELRILGWDYTTRRRKDAAGRVWSYYRLTKWEPWPAGNIRSEISRRETLRRQ